MIWHHFMHVLEQLDKSCKLDNCSNMIVKISGGRKSMVKCLHTAILFLKIKTSTDSPSELLPISSSFLYCIHIVIFVVFFNVGTPEHAKLLVIDLF